MNTKLIYLLIFTFVINVNSQKRIEPNAEDIAQAIKLKEKFDEDDNIAIFSSNEKISFNYNKRANKVTVNHSIEEGLINLDARSDIQKYHFYDGHSKITFFEIYYKNKKRTSFYSKDEAYTSQGLFHNDSRVKFVTLDFPLKGYKYKSVLTEEIDDIKYFTKIYFSNEYPIDKKTITIEIPNWLDLELKEINFKGYNISKKITANKDSKTHTYLLEEIPAELKESSAPGPSYIYPHILVLAKNATINGEKKVLFNATKDLYNWYYSLVKELKNENDAFKNKVLELTKGATTEEQKVKNIFYWVQDNIRYIAFEDGIAGFKPDEATNVFAKKYGDCKGMANLTKQMLLEAGFDARLVWIGTKRIAYDYATPNLSVDNHMICALFKDDKFTFLDATEKYNPFGEYAHRIQGKEALIENKTDFILKKVPNTDISFNEEIINYTLKLEAEDVIGNVVKKYNGERRTELLYILNNIKKDKQNTALKKYLNRGNINLKVSNIKISDLNDRESSLDITYDLTLKNAVSSFDNEIYINLDFDKELSGYNFKERNLDFLFGAKKMLNATTILTIPELYKVSELPKDISTETEDYKLAVTFKQNGNTIIYKKQFKIKNAIIKKTNFDAWNIFNKALNTIYNEQIILIKK